MTCLNQCLSMKEILRFGFKTRFMGGMCPPALLAAAASLRWPVRWREWLLLAAGFGACAGGVLMLSHPFRNEVAHSVPGRPRGWVLSTRTETRSG